MSSAHNVRSRISRGERLLSEMASRGAISDSSRDFLLAALDPMHDTQLKDLQGWPDVETAPSVVRCVKQTIQLTVPSGISGNWDASIVLWPFLNGITGAIAGRVNDIIAIPSTGYVSTGGVAVYGVASGTTVSYESINPSAVIQLDPSYGKGAGRVVGIGIEAVNTTASLYKQGQCTVWRQSNGTLRPSNYTVASNSTAEALSTISCVTIASPPSNLPQVMLIPGSRQWEAADGAYVIGTFVGQDNPPALINHEMPLLLVGTTPDKYQNLVNGASPSVSNTSQVLCPAMFGTVLGTGSAYANQPTRIYPLHQSGIFFSGLSNQSTIALTVNIYVETFPTVAEPEILVLATPSAEYDPVALQLFSHCMRTLPVGVPAGMNPFGEWFADVISEVSDWATPLLSFINPAFGAASAAAGGMAKSYLSKQKQAAAKQASQRPLQIMAPQKSPGNYMTAPSPQMNNVREQKRKNKNRNRTRGNA